MKAKALVEIVYDGDCPFCSRYVQLVQLRDNFDVQLLDARQAPSRTERYRSLGYDLTDGMVVEMGERIYHGPDAIMILSLLSSRSGFWNRIFASCFQSRTVSRLVYPLLRGGRNLALMAMGRRRQV